MPLHVKRTDTSKLDTLQQYNGIRSTRWVIPPPEGEECAGDSDDAYADEAEGGARGEELFDAALSLYVFGDGGMWRSWW
jgi:hypothetical protein